jgi:TP901 family phage tail tape measure protein
MAETVAGLKIQIKLDGADAASARFADLGRISGELRGRLAQIGEEIKRAQAAGDPIRVEALKAAGREIEAGIGKLTRLREAARIEQARTILDVRPWRDIQREIEQARAAYARLAASGKLSLAEQAQAFSRLQSRIAELRSQTNGWAAALEQVKGALVGLGSGTAVFALGVRNAIAFEQAMVGVQRAAGLSRQEAATLGAEFQAMSTRIAVGAGDIARIAAMGAKFGVASKDIARFAELTATAARQFEMLPDEAGRSLGMISRLLGVSIAEMDAFIGMLNASADAVGVAERDIIQALTLAGASAQEFGLTTGQATALATAFLSVGATAEQAGTAMRSLLSRLQAAAQDSGEAGRALQALVGDSKAFSQAIATDAQGALNLLLGRLAELGREDRFAAMKAIFQEGLDTENIAKLVVKLDQYKAAQETAGKSADDFRAALDALNRTDLGTLGAEIQNLRNAAENLGTSIGQTIAPVVRAVTVFIAKAAIAVKAFVDEFPNLSAALGIFATLAVGAGALRIALGGIVLMLGRALGAAASLLAPLRNMGAALATVGGSAPLISRLALAMRALLGPIGLVTSAILLGVEAWNAWKKKAQEAKAAAGGKPEQPRVDAAAPDAPRAAAPQAGTAKPAAPDDGVLRAKLEWERLAQELKAPRQKMAEEIKAIEALGKKLGKPAEEVGRLIAAVRERYAKASGGIGSAGALAAQMSADAEAALAILKDGLERQKQALDAALQDRLVSIRDYHARKTLLEQREIDAEIERRRQEIAAQRAIIANPRATESDRLRAKGDVAKAEADLIVLNNRRADVEQANARAAARAERELADALAAAREELAQLTGTDTAEQRRAAIERSFRDLRARLAAEGNSAGVEIVDRLINVRAAQANLDAIEAAWRQVTERLRNAQEAIGIQQQAGLLTEAQARERIIALQRESAAEMQRLLPLMQQAAQAIGPEAVLRVQAFNNQLERTRLVTDQLAPLWNGIGESFGTALQAMVTGAQSWRAAMAGLFRQVANAFLQQIVIQPFQQWVAMQARMLALKLGFLQQEQAVEKAATAQSVAMKSAETTAKVSMDAAQAGSGAAASQAAIPVVGPGLAIAAMAAMVAAVMALMSKVKKFASGGLVTGPGTATSDSIPARLSAGEYVVRAAAVQRVGVAFLDALNGLRTPPAWDGQRLAFAAGGLVPAVQVAPAAPQVNNAVRIVNAIDPGVTHDHLQTPAGERVILNIIGRNARAVRAALQG